MERKLLVPTVVVAGIIISMLTIVPTALADRDDDDDDDDEKSCKYWFKKAIKEYRKKGYVPTEIKQKALQCLAEGIKSPWKLPEMDETPQRLPLTGLQIEFVESKIEIPVSTGGPFKPIEEIMEIHPCPAGEIVMGKFQIESVGSRTTLQFELQDDKTTLMLRTTNTDTSPDTLVLIAPCLGLIGN